MKKGVGTLAISRHELKKNRVYLVKKYVYGNGGGGGERSKIPDYFALKDKTNTVIILRFQRKGKL